jgi:hypothetical protein
VLLSGARCDRGSRREGGDAPYVDKDQLKGSLFNEDLSPYVDNDQLKGSLFNEDLSPYEASKSRHVCVRGGRRCPPGNVTGSLDHTSS